jgi:hypothetical protein
LSGAFFGTFSLTKHKGFNVSITGMVKKLLHNDYLELFLKNFTFTAPIWCSYFGGLVNFVSPMFKQFELKKKTLTLPTEESPVKPL